MIKLIATDIDGTLVDDRKRLPPDFHRLIELMERRGAAFAVSSGRSYAALIDQFERYADRIYFICDNGANVVFRGEVLSRSLMSHGDVSKVLDLCGEAGLIPLLCGVNGTYYSSRDAEYSAEVRKYYNNTVYAEDLHECAVKDGIYKIAVYQESGIEAGGLPLLNSRFGERLTVCLSGYYWVDIMNAGVHKGSGVKELQRRLGISPEETAAFGDYLNDTEMLKSAYYSFAMENAHPLVKQTARSVIGSNNDFSAVREMLRLLEES